MAPILVTLASNATVPADYADNGCDSSELTLNTNTGGVTTGMLEYGNLNVFYGGLEALVGSPNPNIEETMRAEHKERCDSTKEFVTGNYDTSILSTIATDNDEHHLVAMLAGALARFLAAERVGAASAAKASDGEGAPAWAQLGRRDRLWRNAR